jgi:uncharacterized MAPEG superfamily protein
MTEKASAMTRSTMEITAVQRANTKRNRNHPIECRAIFLPLYAWGIPWRRTFSWNIATVGLVLIMAQLLL